MTIDIKLKQNKLAEIIKASDLDESKAVILVQRFSNYFEMAEEWKRKAEALEVTNESQVTEMKMAGEARKFLKAKRIEVENTRKALKDSSLREGRAIDDVARVLRELIEPIEKDLEQKENFAHLRQAERRAAKIASRIMELTKYHYPYHHSFDDMDDETFEFVLNGAKDADEKRREEQFRKEEEERQEAIRKDKEEKERIAENARLREEAIQKDKELAEQRLKAEAERKAIEAELEAEKKRAEEERKERQRIEAEALRVKQEAEQKAEVERKEREKAEKKARNAPDKVKLIEFGNSLQGLKYPELKSQEAIEILKQAKVLIEKAKGLIDLQTETL